MNERVHIYTRAGAYVNDPERSVEYISKLQWSSAWPGGYGLASFVVPRDIVSTWLVKQAYEVKVYDGLRLVYQGRLGDLRRQLAGGAEQIVVEAAGPKVILAERLIRKRWIDRAAVSRFEWPVKGDTQESFAILKREDFIRVQMAITGNVDRTTETYREKYTFPAGTTVRRVTFDWKIRTGEGIAIILYDIDHSSTEFTQTGTDSTGSSGNIDLAAAANIIEFRFACDSPLLPASDQFNEDDYGFIDNLIIYASMAFASGSPAYDYHADEIVKDILNTVTGFSTDYDEIGDPGIELSPFITANDGYESALSIIDRAAAYGDTDGHTWGFAVWGDGSDGNPKCALSEYSVSDYEYTVSLDELDGFERVELDRGIYNNAFVRFVNLQGITKYRTPTDNASLTNAASIALYGQRDIALDAGHATTTTADYFGIRYITRHKDPQWRVSASITGKIRNKQGVWVPANKVRAGQRVRLLDYAETFFIRQASYNADSGVLRIESAPPDDIDVILAQRSLMAE